MRQLRMAVLVSLMLFLFTGSTVAAVPVNEDERYAYLSERNGFYYYGWNFNGSKKSFSNDIWVKIVPEKGLLKERGSILAIDSILCRIEGKEGLKNLSVAEQIYFGPNGTVIPQGEKWEEECGQALMEFISDECTAFLTAYFNFK